jgi:hypothetical protein
MFDRIHVHPTKHVPYEKSVTVHEHRAPTDESVRILDEMRAKAERDIAAVFITKDNSLADAAVLFQPVPGGAGFEWAAAVAFKLNGREIVLHERMAHADLVGDPREALRVLQKKLAERLMQELTPLVIEAVVRRGR